MSGRQATTDTIRVLVNDQQHEVPGATMLATLLGELGLADRRGVAVAHNGVVVPRKNWSTRQLTAGDRVIVIQATQGG
jgi:sulfur carrier protein